MGVVNRLPSALVNQIAAGEVVERPASAVKELIENALDASAGRIEVAIDAGGLGRIAVLDDGVGMSEEDAVLALERHATSKLHTFDDLAALGTFGFRGEALPSIASVSRFRLVTRRAEHKHGIAVTVDAHGTISATPCGAAEGTRVEAAELFYNVPARRKFLKSVATETAHVNDVVRSAALARHDVSFVLRRDGKVSREYLRAPNRHERAIALAQGEPLTPVRFSRGPLEVEAYLAPAERARAGANHLDILVNGRPVRDLKLARAVAHAFGGALDNGRYPFGVLYLELPTSEVDVNVHPQKSEVRFADSRAVYEALRFALEQQLGAAFGAPTRSIGNAAGFTRRSPTASPERPGISSFVVGAAAPARSESAAAPAARPAPSPPVAGSAADEPSLFKSVRFYAGLRFLGESRDSYLVCEGQDGLYVLDRHAASERLSLHQLLNAARPLARRALPSAETVTLDRAAHAAVLADESWLGAIGFELRAVSETTLSLHAVPALLGPFEAKALIGELARELAEHGPGEALLATLACHGAWRARQAVSRAEVEALLAALDDVDFSRLCRHPRPVLYRLGFDEIERKGSR